MHGVKCFFASFLHWHRMGEKCWADCFPNALANATAMEDLALGFITGILAGARKLSQVAHLRRDPLLPELLGIEGIGGQSAFSQFSFSVSPARPPTANALAVSGGGVPSRGYAHARRVTRWMWTARNCCTRTGHQKEGIGHRPCPARTKAGVSSAAGHCGGGQVGGGFWLRPGNSRCDTNRGGFHARNCWRVCPSGCPSGWCGSRFGLLLRSRRAARGKPALVLHRGDQTV